MQDPRYQILNMQLYYTFGVSISSGLNLISREPRNKRKKDKPECILELAEIIIIMFIYLFFSYFYEEII